jgi:hypothetical protein
VFGRQRSGPALIEFLAETEACEIFDPPSPAKDFLADWYKRMPNYSTPEREVGQYGHFNSTIKHCMPVLDAMTAGYMLTMPQDLHVTLNQNGEVKTAWPVDGVTLIESHNLEQISEYKIDTERWSPVALKLINRWVVKTPPGYSTLFMSPLWRDDYRMHALPGIVDTDRYPQPINFPFFIQKNFVGTIEVGTPVVQLIPFKRDDWKSSTGLSTKEMKTEWRRATRQSIFRYKQLFRSQKSYS